MGRLEGKAAFITGGGAGIGAAAAALFAREGASVTVTDIDGTAASRVVTDLPGALGVRMDVTSDTEVASVLAQSMDRFGRLDILFNSAGGSLMDRDDFIADVDLSVWEPTMNLNLLGTILPCRHAIPLMQRTNGGSIVNMSSGAALRGASPSHIYTAAKGAILSLTRALAGAYAKHNIRANAICAGRTLTGRIVNAVGTPDSAGKMPDRQDAAGRVKEYPFWVGSAEDIANIALFLASDESRMITGASIPADGGRSAY